MSTSQKQTSLKHTSVKQIEANRRNSKKSTGAKTESGKQNSATNNLKHGLYSTQIVIKSAAYSEDPNEYKQLVESLYEELNPVGEFQKNLVNKIANCFWRSHRVVRAETAHINAQMDRSYVDIEEAEKRKRWKVRDDYETDSELTAEELERVVDNSVGKRSIPNDSTALYILRCEMRLDRQLSRAYALLRQLQAKAEADFKKVKAVYKEREEDKADTSCRSGFLKPDKDIVEESELERRGRRRSRPTDESEGETEAQQGPPEYDGSKPFLYGHDPTIEPLTVSVRKHRRRARANSS